MTHSHRRHWFSPPDRITRETGITQGQRRALKRLLWTGPCKVRETPHPLVYFRLYDRRLVGIEDGVVSLSAEGKRALGEIERLEKAA